jgi:hypothetical protein
MEVQPDAIAAAGNDAAVVVAIEDDSADSLGNGAVEIPNVGARSQIDLLVVAGRLGEDGVSDVVSVDGAHHRAGRAFAEHGATGLGGHVLVVVLRGLVEEAAEDRSEGDAVGDLVAASALGADDRECDREDLVVGRLQLDDATQARPTRGIFAGGGDLGRGGGQGA